MTDATADAGQEIRLQCSPVRRVILDHNDDEMQTTGNAEVVLSFPPSIHSPKKIRAVTPKTRTACISHPPAARAAPRRRLAADAGHKSLLDVSCDTSYDCANTTRDDSSFDFQLHGGGGGHGGHNLTGLGLSAINSSINDDGDLQHEDDVDFVPRILFPEEMMHGTSGPTDGDIADVEDNFDHDDASDIEDEEEEDEYTHSDYLNTSHQSSAAYSSPFKDLTNVGGGGKQQQKRKENDVTQATASLSASFFHNLSSTFADSFCVGSAAAASPGGVHRTPQASPFRRTAIPRASPSLEGPAGTPHRRHHLPRPSPSRSLVLSTPMLTMTPRRLVTVSSGDAADSSINKSTLSEMEDAVREHFRHLDCYANTGTPIRTPGRPPAETNRTPQKQQLTVSGCSTENEDDANLLVTSSNRNKFCNRSAQPVRLQTERVRRLYFHGTPSETEPYSNDDPASKLEMAADPCLLSRRRQVESSASDAPSFVVSRAASFDDISFNGSKNGGFLEESAGEEEHDADLSNLIGCINPISILNEIEQDTGRTDTAIPSDDVCYDSDPGGVEQTLSRRKHLDLGSASANGVHCEGVGSKEIQRTLNFSIATAQVRALHVYIYICFLSIADTMHLLHLAALITVLIFSRRFFFLSSTANTQRNNFTNLAPRGTRRLQTSPTKTHYAMDGPRPDTQ